jgi:RimJ/RimL family protein N-acetyltransferase
MSLVPDPSHPTATRSLADRPSLLAEPMGYFYTWWRGDPLPELRSQQSLVIEQSADAAVLAAASKLSDEEIARRIDGGHQPWLASLQGEPAGWGWVATRVASIGGSDITILLPATDRYLWDFETPQKWRGQGVYPALLQTILLAEPDIERYWIGHDRANHASGRGILRAGFERIGAVHPTTDGGMVYVPHGRAERAHAAATLLGLPVAEPAA